MNIKDYPYAVDMTHHLRDHDMFYNSIRGLVNWCIESAMEFTTERYGNNIDFRFKKANDAMRFKLVWG